MIKKVLILIIAITLIQCVFATNYNLSMNNIQDKIEAQEGLRPGNEPYMMGTQDNKVGIILFHGFTASPWEVKELTESLSNITVYAPLVAGHGRTETDLKKTTWEEWYEEANKDFNLMNEMYDCVYVGGMSTGGTIALMLAAEHEVCGIVSIGTPIYFQDWKVKYAWIFKYIMPFTTKELSEEEKPYYYEKRPVASIAELYEMVKHLKKNIQNIDEPILILHSSKDQVIKPESAEFILNNVNSSNKQIILFNESPHVIIKGTQKEEAFKLISEFIQENS